MPKPTYLELSTQAKRLADENLALKNTVDRLKEDVKQLRELVENTNSIILKIDPQGNVKFINQFAQKFFGYTEMEIFGKNIIGTIVPPIETSGRDLAEMIRHLGQHPERCINNENENIGKDGRRVWIAWTNKGIQNGAGMISEIICVGNEITQRREAEQALFEKEAQLRTAIESLPFGFFALDETGRYMMQNSTCKKNWGDLIGKRPEDLGVDDKTLALWKSNNRRAYAGEIVEGEVALQPQGKQGYYHNIVSPIHDGNRIRGILGVDIDITQRKHAEDALLARERELGDKTRDLEEMNTALKVLIKKRDNDRGELEENILLNIKELIEPYLDNLQMTRLSARQKSLLDIILDNLAEITSCFARKFTTIKYKLTPQQLQISGLIRQGKTTREIAEIMNLSIRTIEFHRTKIREKIGLRGKKDSLQAYLSSHNQH